MSAKRFECVLVKDDVFEGTFRRLKDNETNTTYVSFFGVADLLNFQNTQIKILKEENEQLRQFINKGRRLSVKELMDNANENELLKKKIRGLEKENEQLSKKIKRLEQENNALDLNVKWFAHQLENYTF